MGKIISICSEPVPLQFRIWYTTTGEEREVTVDREKEDLVRAGTAEVPSPACPFLRRGPHEFICSIHGSRPDLCRQYSCFRILAMDLQGKKAGRVMNASRYLVTEDTNLRTIWQDEIRDADIPDEMRWEEYVAHVLTRRGFSLIL